MSSAAIFVWRLRAQIIMGLLLFVKILGIYRIECVSSSSEGTMLVFMSEAV